MKYLKILKRLTYYFQVLIFLNIPHQLYAASQPELHRLLDTRISECLVNIYNLNFSQASTLQNEYFSTSSVEYNLVNVNLIWWGILCGNNPNEEYKRINQIFETSYQRYTSNEPNNKQLFLCISSGIFKFRTEAILNNYSQMLKTSYILSKLYKILLKQEITTYEEAFLVATYKMIIDALKQKKLLSAPILLFLPNTSNNITLNRISIEQFENCKIPELLFETDYAIYKTSKELIEKNKKSEIKLGDLIRLYPNNIVLKLELLKCRKEKNDSILPNEIEELIVFIRNEKHLNFNQKNHFTKLLTQYIKP